MQSSSKRTTTHAAQLLIVIPTLAVLLVGAAASFNLVQRIAYLSGVDIPANETVNDMVDHYVGRIMIANFLLGIACIVVQRRFCVVVGILAILQSCFLLLLLMGLISFI